MEDGNASISERLRHARMEAFLSPSNQPRKLSSDPLDALLARAGAIHAQAVTEHTRATYARRWVKFTGWCDAHGLESLPASPETLMLYLADAVAGETVSLSTLRGRAAAIARIHLEAGFPAPTIDPAMTLFLRGLSKMVPYRPPPEQTSALRINDLRQVCRVIEANAVDAREIRDRAILGLLDSGATIAGLARLTWPEVEFTDGSLTITLLPVGRHITSKTVHVLARPDDLGACPVEAVRAWRNVVGNTSGLVFVHIQGRQPTKSCLAHHAILKVRTSRLDSLGLPGRPATTQAAMRLLGQQRSIDLRDKAVMLIGFAGAFRRNEVTGLRWADVTRRDAAGVVLHLRRSKTDQAGRGRDVGIPFGRSTLTCPVIALAQWHERLTQQYGEVEPETPIFVKVGASGRIGTEPLTDEALTRLVARRAQAAGLEGHWGGRSLRAGFISTAADLEIPLEKVAAQSRHATLDSLALYIRRIDPFRGSAAGKVGL